MTKHPFAMPCVIFGVLLVTSPFSSAHSGKIESNKVDSALIDGLSMDPDPVPVQVTHQREGRVLTAILRGKFARPDWGLIYKHAAGLESAFIHADGSFELPIYPDSERTRITLKAVGPLGKVETTETSFVIDNWDEVEKEWHYSQPKLYGLTPSVGFTSASFSQTGAAAYSGILLTGKLAYGKTFASSPWSISASAFASFLPLQSNQSEIQARYIGLNARTGYVLPFQSRVWKASLMAGIYYSTMFVTNHVFGYQDVSGPQLYPTLQRFFANGDVGSAYFKYSPVSNSLGFLNLGNREIAGGISWIHAFGSRYFSFNLDLANLHLLLKAIEIQSTTSTLSVGVEF